MVRGYFIDNTPFVEIIIAWFDSIKFYVILDTGFSGDLQVSKDIADKIGLKITDVTQVTIANGDTIKVPLALAAINIEGRIEMVNVIISGDSPLLGINCLSRFGYKAIVDCKNKKVSLLK